MAGWERTRLSRDRKKAGEHLTSAWASSALDTLLLLSSEPLLPAGDRTHCSCLSAPFLSANWEETSWEVSIHFHQPHIGWLFPFPGDPLWLTGHTPALACGCRVPGPGHAWQDWCLSKYSKYYKQPRGGVRGSERRSSEPLAASGSSYPIPPPHPVKSSMKPGSCLLLVSMLRGSRIYMAGGGAGNGMAARWTQTQRSPFHAALC